ncbi:MAG: PAS domain S-box protein [Nitrospirales bacterium]|nr:PAS domain S-box protein [Nitrospirales bacterium]
MFGLYLTSLYSYVLFHSLVEIFSIVIGCSIFILTWNSRDRLDNNYLLFLGIAYLFVSGLDLVHTLAYKGMGVFAGYNANLPTQLWIAARYLQGFSLLISPFFLHRKLNIHFLLLGHLTLTVLLLTSIFSGIFPDCFVEGAGLTPFKKNSEYIISVMLLASVGLLLRNRNVFDSQVLKWLIISLFLTIGAELAFTFYINVYGLSNLVGHFFKLIAFYFIYKAIVEVGLKRPHNLLFRNMQQNESELRNALGKVQLLASIVHSSDDAIIGKNMEGIIESWNSGAEHIYGYTEEEVKGRHISILLPDRSSDETADILKRVQRDEKVEQYETLRRRKDGSLITVSLTVSPIRDAAGVIAGASIIARDITERKVMEEKIRKYMTSLERSNKELEQFAYVASHDLQEPLRRIISFTDLLAQKYSGQLDEKADTYIRFIVSGAMRMSTLINDLLTYSRVTTKGKELSPTDMTEVISMVMKDMSLSIEESGASITVDMLPTVMADDAQIGQVFQNLISNAIKFRGHASPVIHVSAIPIPEFLTKGQQVPPEIRQHLQEAGRGWVFSLRDNGIGIEPQYSHQIFEIFQRLHTQEEYPGTGIGLAVCKKVVERHGGKIWVESEKGKGTTFSFSLPEK